MFGKEDVWVEIHRGIAWDKVENLDPQSTPQLLPSVEEYTSPVTYPEEVENTLGTLIEVEPLNKTKLEEVGMNSNHNTPLSSREIPSFDGPNPQPLLNSPSLDVSLGDVIGLEPPIKPHSLDSSRMKVVDYLTTQTPPSPHMANSHPKGEELSLFDRPNEVEKGRILEAHRLEPILQQQLSQCMAPSYHDGRKAHLLEDKQIPSVGVFDEVYFSFGRHLEELHVTWAHLEKKRTRLRTYTNIDQEFLYSGWRRRHRYNMTSSPRKLR
ncbi:hypothetical protein Tco_1363550 [Tanacetum coccineum]